MGKDGLETASAATTSAHRRRYRGLIDDAALALQAPGARMSLAAAVLAVALAATPASPPATPARAPAIADEAPPTAQEVRANTLPLVRARLRLPDSLQDFAVAEVAPTAQDSARFVIRVTFKARTPFGSVTAHEARFAMKRSASKAVWNTTAQ